MEKSVIFLDFDGVLVTPSSNNNRITSKKFSKRRIYILDRIAKHCDSVIVLSTFWRLIYDFDTLKSWLSFRGLKTPVIDKTEHLPNWNRGREILLWLQVHPQYTSYLVIDDTFSHQELSPIDDCRIIKTYWDKTNPHQKIGLHPSHINEAIGKIRNQR